MANASVLGKLQIAEADLAAQARQAALAAGKGIQSGTQGAARGFNNFVEGGAGGMGDGAGSTSRRGAAEPEKKDFWDNFGDERKQPEKKDFWDSFGEDKSGNGSVGTTAMKKGGAGGKGEGGWDNW